MSFFSFKKNKIHSQMIIDDTTEKMIDNDNKTIYDIIKKIVNIANSHIMVNNSNSIFAGGKRIKRKTKSRTKSRKIKK